MRTTASGRCRAASGPGELLRGRFAPTGRSAGWWLSRTAPLREQHSSMTMQARDVSRRGFGAYPLGQPSPHKRLGARRQDRTMPGAWRAAGRDHDVRLCFRGSRDLGPSSHVGAIPPVSPCSAQDRLRSCLSVLRALSDLAACTLPPLLPSSTPLCHRLHTCASTIKAARRLWSALRRASIWAAASARTRCRSRPSGLAGRRCAGRRD
jgi:hypothetical protein